ncbi:type II toxin-antitoxin system VapC family toxin [Candidatus Electronema sp. PJ]|uniref:type II toxin-antitoxin system VapC family toxin n=1 Tax=Candidatus Electronema sp. PJ TaxID=3401572 RepID=UPI003AA89B63
MNPSLLLDTDTCSFIIKGGFPKLDARLREIQPGQLAISAVTRAELRYGLVLRPHATRLAVLVESFLEAVVCLPWDSLAADSYGQLRALLQQKGRPIGDHDTMIAAHALSLDLTLITHNTAHFQHVPRLHCIDWLEA